MRAIAGSTRDPTRSILIGAALLLSLGMGLRQSFGLFLTPVTRDLAITASSFTLVIAIQNGVPRSIASVTGIIKVPSEPAAETIPNTLLRLFSDTARAQAVITNDDAVHDNATPISAPDMISAAAPQRRWRWP